MAFFNNEKISNSWFIAAFAIKILTSFLLTLLYTNYYGDRSTADIFKYFDDGLVMYKALKTNPEDFFKMLFAFESSSDYFTQNYYTVMKHWSRPYNDGLFSDTHVIIRFNAVIHLISFGFIHVHNVFINFVSLVGLTYIYKAFKPFLKKKEKLLFYFLFLVPSILFWGSGLLKESIIFFGLGLFCFNLFKLKNQFKISYLVLIVIAIGLIIYTKFYLLVAFSISILGYLLNLYFPIKKIFYGYLISFTAIFGATYLTPLINERFNFVRQIAVKQQDFSRFIKIEGASSGFLLPELSDGFSILLNIPNALIITFVRPFLWECNSLFVWLSAFENVIVLGCIAIAIIFRKKMNKAQQNIFYFTTIFVVSLFILIGLTTPVFGAIMRYKVPGLILLFISLLLIVDLEKIKRKYPIFKKIL